MVAVGILGMLLRQEHCVVSMWWVSSPSGRLLLSLSTAVSQRKSRPSKSGSRVMRRSRTSGERVGPRTCAMKHR